MEASNAVGIYRFASDHNCLLLKSAAFNFISNNFVLVVSEEEFVDIPKDVLIHFLSSEQLHVDSEYQVGLKHCFDCASIWFWSEKILGSSDF